MSNTTVMSTANENNAFPTIESIFSNSEIKDQLAQNGLNGLEFDHSSFPTISLKGTFEMSDYSDFDLKTFDVRVMQSLKKYILLDASEESKKVMKEVKYSRDGLNTTQGEPLKNYIEYITDNGGRPMLKTYLDVLVQMLTGDYNNMIAILSISPTSVSRISGLFYQLQLQGKLQQLKEVIFTVSRGQQRMSRGGQSYWLWAMNVKKEIQAA